MRVTVTGGAGFIGSNLVHQLLADGHDVRVVDNFSTGRRKNLGSALTHERLSLLERDLVDPASAQEAVRGVDVVYHLAANADVRDGWQHPRKDHEQNTVVTHNVLEGMRISQTPRIVFSSTGSVYGAAPIVPTPETCPFPIQTSLYGASKIAAEGLISSYVEAGYLTATIFRFVSVLGPRYSHGHVADFVRQLLSHPDKLTILGNGLQTKSYLNVADCVAALTQQLKPTQPLCIFNLGVDDAIKVDQSIDFITSVLGVSPTRTYTGGEQGWIGDNPLIRLDISAIRSTGWNPKHSIKDSVMETAKWLLENRWALDASSD